MTANRTYLILDTQNHALANGELAPPADAVPMRLNVLHNKVDNVMAHEVITLFSSSSEEPPIQCRILRQRGDTVLLEKIATLDPEVRRNLRVPVKFDTFLYPLPSSSWGGRRTAKSIDLSCGGIAFYADCQLELHEQMEIVVTPTEEPVILRCEILRKQELQNDRFMYATKFVDMCEDEEVVVREAVFSLQLQSRDAQD
nr:PilZ domain-containing protein [uncultured Oscillibacter sp.]